MSEPANFHLGFSLVCREKMGELFIFALPQSLRRNFLELDVASVWTADEARRPAI
jgi:hypothetical protein